MDIIKEKVSNWLGYFKDYINYFQIVEQQKNVVYFSKFNLETNEFFEIHNFVLTLKVNIFRSLIEQFKYCANNFLIFENNNLTEKEKVMVIYSACFLNYYKKFCFDINHTFEEYYDDNFMSLIKTIFKFEISNNQLFKVFCFCFFDKMKEEIGNLNYEKIKPLKLAYNPRLYNNNLNVNNNINNSNNNNSKEEDKNNINSISEMDTEESGFQENILTYLISAKEKIVDLVFEMRYRGIFPKVCANEINRMNDRLHQLGDKSAQELHNLNNIPQTNIQNDSSFIKSFNNSFFQNDNNLNKFDEKINNIFNNSINKSNTNFNETKNTINSINSMNSFVTDSSSINCYNNNINTFNINNIDSNNNINSINEKNKSLNNINIININNMNNLNLIDLKNINQNHINIPNNINTINNSINPNTINNKINSAFKPNQNININSSNDNSNNNNNMYSQRIISALMKNEVDNKTLEIIKNVAKKIDDQYLHSSLNNRQKPIIIIKYFSCYIVEFTPEMLQKIEPKYKDILNNFCIKFIILAKELYNTTMELFCAIYDLSYTNIDTFLDLSRNCGIQVKYAQGLYKFFKDYSLLLLEKNSTLNLKNTVQKLIEKEKKNWDRIINQKSDDSLPFFKVNNI